jgi:lipopolysaccharide export system permease protein
MRLLDRYLLRELLVPLGFCLCAFLIFWISFDLFPELPHFQELKLHGQDVAEYYLVKTPQFMVIGLPVALLVALLYALTNHSRHHELTAIRAAGVGLWRMCAPYLVIGFIGSVALFAMNELWVPNIEQKAAKILNRRLEKSGGNAAEDQAAISGFSNSRVGRTWHFDSYNLKTSEMIGPKVYWRRRDGSQIELLGDRAVWTNGAWTFFGAKEHTYAGGSGELTNRNLQAVLTEPALTETPEMIRSEIKIRSRLDKRIKTPDIPLTELLDYLRLHPDPEARQRAFLYTQLHGRLAMPWTCVVVVLIAVPFGAASGRRNVFVGVASSIVICFTYFVLLQCGLALGGGGTVAPWLGAWLPNIVAAAPGLVLARRVR